MENRIPNQLMAIALLGKRTSKNRPVKVSLSYCSYAILVQSAQCSSKMTNIFGPKTVFNQIFVLFRQSHIIWNAHQTIYWRCEKHTWSLALTHCCKTRYWTPLLEHLLSLEKWNYSFFFQGHESLVKYLIKLIDVNRQDEDKFTPLHFAADNRKLKFKLHLV